MLSGNCLVHVVCGITADVKLFYKNSYRHVPNLDHPSLLELKKIMNEEADFKTEIKTG